MCSPALWAGFTVICTLSLFFKKKYVCQTFKTLTTNIQKNFKIYYMKMVLFFTLGKQIILLIYSTATLIHYSLAMH